MKSMGSVASAILNRVETSVPKLRALPESETVHKPSPDRWSKKEILGHLTGPPSTAPHPEGERQGLKT